MSPTDPRIEAIFHEALDRAPAEREAFIAKACAGDESLQKEVQRLLAAHEDAGTYFERPNSPEIEAELARLKPEEEGQHIGRYKLLQEIGQGGFGTVWMAEQMEPVSRRVALKILKLGMDTREVIGRFEQERQALAMMDHPNIAKVFDAGATPFGRPYFVMELVKGVPITEFCDQQQLDTRQRLELFADVCSAINHAHQKGVIHRDIKPSNVMITLHGDKAVVKVIDFGIAKATRGKLTDKTLFTRYEQFIGTPVYMSPEQATMSGLDIDTRSDIYALGILLYELLTGKPPFDAQTLVSAGYEEMRRIIREVEPPRPSLRLSTTSKEERTTLAKARQVPPEKLHRQIEPDLDWIVMKAIEKDRTRRYETANGLALDIQRFLADEPVTASPPSAIYRFGKFARRNKLGLAAGAAVAAALIIGLIASLWQADRAETEAAKATASELNMRHFLYAADVNRAQDALRVNNLGRARRLLDQHRPKPGEQDLRGWEWRYLWQQCRSGAIATLAKHNKIVHSVTFSADSKLLAVAIGDELLEVWDVPNRTRVASLQPDGGVGAIRFAPHGYLLAQSAGTGVPAHRSAPNALSQINLYDFASNEAPVTFEVGANIQAFCFSQSGTSLLCRTAGQKPRLGSPPFRLVDFARREIVATGMPSGFVAYQPAGRIRFSPDSTRYFAGTRSGRALSVGVFRQSDDVLEHEFMVGNNDFLYGMDTSLDGKILVTGTGWEDSIIQVWDTVGFKQIVQLDRHASWISELTFSPDGRTLASASGDQTVRLWDTSTWKERAVLRGHGDEVWAVAFSPDGKILASGAKDGEVLLWNNEFSPISEARFAFPNEVQRAVFLPGEPWILTKSAGGKYSVWSLPSLKETTLEFEPAELFQNLAAKGVTGEKSSPNGRFSAAPSIMSIVTFFDRRMELPTTLQGHLLAVNGIAFTPDSNRVATTSTGREAAKVWDTATRQELLNLPGHGTGLDYAEFSEDGNVLLVGSPTSNWQLWRAPSWAEIEAAEGSGGRWPPTEVPAATASAISQLELKDLIARTQRRLSNE